MSFCHPLDNNNEAALSGMFSDLELSCLVNDEYKTKTIDEYSSGFQSLVLKCYRNKYITVITSDNQIAFVNYEMFKNVSAFIKPFVENRQPLKINFSLFIVNIAINMWYGKEPRDLDGHEIEVYQFAKEFNIEFLMDECIKIFCQNINKENFDRMNHFATEESIECLQQKIYEYLH